MRKVHIEGNQTFLNNKPIYQRLVLDQGFYPDGIWTAPTDEDLKKDIELSMAAGFNGARLHQKVFEERFHYWADKLGYLTWGESSSWGIEPDSIKGYRNFASEWNEIIVRDRNKPSIIAWTPFNETRTIKSAKLHKRAHIEIYNLTKSLDPTRPVNDASGYIHYKTDIWTIHLYERAKELDQKLEQAQKEEGAAHCIDEHKDKEVRYQGQPYILDEFGGIKWIHQDEEAFADNTWGYGNDVRSLEDFYNTLEAEIDVINKYPEMTGWCYTQLTDVEQEQNGIYTYDRKAKFDIDRIKSIFEKR
jgi:beta-galactosidase/beta-glucuronidase